MNQGERSGVDEGGFLSEEYVNRLGMLTDALESGDETVVRDVIGELTTLRESSLYVELGKLTREIHESINRFGSDERIGELAHEAIPDAKERLSFIVTKTEEAAHRTMCGAEETGVLMDSISSKVNAIHQRWARFRNRELSRQEFVELSHDMDAFFESIGADSQAVNSKMTDIMMAQDYQDITGQMIKQVVNMVQEIEEKLVRLVAISGSKSRTATNEPVDGQKAHGPQLPTADKDKVATSQGEVDDLLASLGF